jgi:hypothetical protein
VVSFVKKPHRISDYLLKGEERGRELKSPLPLWERGRELKSPFPLWERGRELKSPLPLWERVRERGY